VRSEKLVASGQQINWQNNSLLSSSTRIFSLGYLQTMSVTTSRSYSTSQYGGRIMNCKLFITKWLRPSWGTITQHLSGGIEEIHKKPESQYPVL
jgi:hypothetical protein